MVTTEGSTSGPEAAAIMANSGSKDAIMLDGSGSSQMYANGEMRQSGDKRLIVNAVVVVKK